MPSAVGVAVVVPARTSEPPCFSVIDIPASRPGLASTARRARTRRSWRAGRARTRAASSGSRRSAGTAAYVIEIGQRVPGLELAHQVEPGRPGHVRAGAGLGDPRRAVQPPAHRRAHQPVPRRVELDLVDAVAVAVVGVQHRRVGVGEAGVLACLGRGDERGQAAAARGSASSAPSRATASARAGSQASGSTRPVVAAGSRRGACDGRRAAAAARRAAGGLAVPTAGPGREPSRPPRSAWGGIVGAAPAGCEHGRAGNGPDAPRVRALRIQPRSESSDRCARSGRLCAAYGDRRPSDRRAHVTRGRHRLRDELDPAAGRRRDHRRRTACPRCATCTARRGSSGSARASTPPASWHPRRSSALAPRSPTTRRCCAARAPSACAWSPPAPLATPATARTSSAWSATPSATDAEVISGDEEAQLVVHRCGRRPRPRRRPVRRGRHRRRLHRARRRHARADGRRDGAGGPLGRHRQRPDHRALPARRPAAARRGGARRASWPPRILDDAFDAVPVDGRAHVGRRRGHDHHAVRGGAAPARVRPGRRAPVPALRERTCTGSPRSCSACPARSAAAHRSIHPGRIDVIGGGALIVDVLAERAARARGRHRARGERARHPRRHRPLHRLKTPPFRESRSPCTRVALSVHASRAVSARESRAPCA